MKLIILCQNSAIIPLNFDFINSFIQFESLKSSEEEVTKKLKKSEDSLKAKVDEIDKAKKDYKALQAVSFEIIESISSLTLMYTTHKTLSKM